MSGTSPVLLDRKEAMIALDMTGGVFDEWIREGRLDDWVAVGDRQLFRAAQLQERILDRRRELTEKVASRRISEAVKARLSRERRRTAREVKHLEVCA